jgi:hypothetical protein
LLIPGESFSPGFQSTISHYQSIMNFCYPSAHA